MRIPTSVAVAAGVALSVFGCVPADSDVVCTNDFRSISVEVTDSAGRPVNGLDPQVTFDRTRKPVPNAGFENQFREGDYTVVDDTLSNALEGRTERITFRVSAPQGSATGRFVVGADSCHITKVSGPDTLVLE